MIMLNKKDAKVRVESYSARLSHMINHPVVLSLGPHRFHMKIEELGLSKLTELAITPDKVYNEETEKSQTPQVMYVKFVSGERINIVLDDIDEFNVGVDGAVFNIGSEVLRIEYDNQNKARVGSSSS